MVFGIIGILFFALMGMTALINPRFIQSSLGIEFYTPNARSEVRAVYGGFGLFVAAALSIGLYDTALQAGIFLTVALALFGMAFGRIVSALTERPTSIIWVFLGGEVIPKRIHKSGNRFCEKMRDKSKA